LAPSLLLVDDEPMVLRALKRIISASHPQWRLLEASDGVRALEILRVRPVHTLIADLQMPRMDGATLLRHVLQDYPHVLRIVHSSQKLEGPTLNELVHARIPKPAQATSVISVLDWARESVPMQDGGSACA
jgi:DNA-binding NarL/FixJ family response regulator